MKIDKKYKLVLNIVLFIIGTITTIVFFTELNDEIYEHYVIYNIVISSIIIIYLVIVLCKYKIHYSKYEKFNLYRYIDFENISPIYAGELIGIKTLPLNKILIIIYDLADKDIINIRYENDKTYISLKKDINLETINRLEHYESSVVKMIFKSSTDVSEYEISDVINALKKDKQKLVFIEKELKSLNAKMHNEYYQLLLYDLEDKNIIMFSIVSCYAAIRLMQFIPTFGMFLVREMYYLLLLYLPWIIISAILLLVCFVKDKYIVEVNKLRGLYKFLTDFSNFNNLGIKYIEIYEEYYLYALSFNLTDEVIKKYDSNNVLSGRSSSLKYIYMNIKDGTENEWVDYFKNIFNNINYLIYTKYYRNNYFFKNTQRRYKAYNYISIINFFNNDGTDYRFLQLYRT